MTSGWGCVRDKYESIMEQIDSTLHQKNSFTELLEKVEKKTKIPRLRMVQAVMLLVITIIIITLGSELISNCIGFIYPAYASIKAIESLKKEDDTRWLTYWVVYGFFIFIESITDCLLSWFPFYWVTKCVFLLWCMLPSSSNGSDFIYNFLIRPFFLKHHREIDNALDKAHASARGYLDNVSSTMQPMNTRLYNDAYNNYDDRDAAYSGRLGELRSKYGGERLSPERSLDVSRSRLFNNEGGGGRRSGSRSPERESRERPFANDRSHERSSNHQDEVSNRSRKQQESLDYNPSHQSNGYSNGSVRSTARKSGGYKNEEGSVRGNTRN